MKYSHVTMVHIPLNHDTWKWGSPNAATHTPKYFVSSAWVDYLLANAVDTLDGAILESPISYFDSFITSFRDISRHSCQHICLAI